MTSRWIAAAALACAALIGCGTADPELNSTDRGNDDDGEACHGGGESIAVDGHLFCVYPQAIIETGFRCPPDMPYMYQTDRGVICSVEEGLPASLIEEAFDQVLPPSGAGDLEVEPDGTCLDFGFVQPGSSASLSLTLRNTGSRPLTVDSLAMSSGSAAAYSLGSSAPLTVPDDDPRTTASENELDVNVTFAPAATDAGRLDGEVEIEWTAANGHTGSSTVCVTGFAGGPAISCTPASLDFGQVAVGMPRTESFVCASTGSDDPNETTDNLVIDAVNVAGEFSATIRNDDGSTGAKAGGYAAGETFTVDVTYAPVDGGQDSATLEIESNALATPAIEVQLAAHGRALGDCDFELRPTELHFGIVDAGDTAGAELGIANIGSDDCLIRDLQVTDDTGNAFSADPIDEAILPAGQELRVRVQFSPPSYSVTAYTAAVRFDISDPAAPEQEVGLRGVSRSTCLLISPSHMDMGAVAPGCNARERFVTITNRCNSPVTVTAIDVPTTGGASDEFIVRRRPAVIDTGVSLSPGSQTEFTVTYAPDDEGSDLGMVFIETVEYAQPHMLTLEGRGANDPIQSDSFVQAASQKVDVLLVIDNSSGMAPYQQELADHLADFLQFAQNQAIDFQLGVTTTGITQSSGCPGGVNGGEDGRLFPVIGAAPRLLTPRTPMLEDHWASNVSVGTCHGTEMGLEAAYRALSSPLIDNSEDPRHPETNDGNLGLLRSDAALSVIFVSDEEDQSPQSTTFYFNYLQSLKGVRSDNLFAAHAIVGDKDTGCSTATSSADPGNRYIALAEQSGGMWRSICTTDWQSTLQDIGAAAFGHRTRFFLTSEPEDTNADGRLCDRDCDADGTPDAEIIVRVDGVVQESQLLTGATVWTYDAASNGVDFSPLFAPEAGATIEITYSVACLAP